MQLSKAAANTEEPEPQLKVALVLRVVLYSNAVVKGVPFRVESAGVNVL